MFRNLLSQIYIACCTALITVAQLLISGNKNELISSKGVLLSLYFAVQFFSFLVVDNFFAPSKGLLCTSRSFVYILNGAYSYQLF